MENLYLRLLQLRAELENSANSPKRGFSSLNTIRRELLRCYYALPRRQLQFCPGDLQDQFYQAQQHLQQPLPFPGANTQAQYADTEQALNVLEWVASCSGEPEQLLA